MKLFGLNTSEVDISLQNGTVINVGSIPDHVS